MIREIPTIAVIGRVNKGKSSVVSTLAEDDSVKIDAAPGTTKFCQEFPIRVDGKILLILFDTPGFQDAPRALAWLKRHEGSVTNRREVVAQFVETFKRSKDFVDECRLLDPILHGAGILYVVDGAKPYRKHYEAEMEILRWTSQPRMALINKIGEGDFSEQWRPALDQYFSVVRSFNAQHVGFGDRIRLLQAFRELHEPWRNLLEEAIRFLEAEWERRKSVTANIIVRLLLDELSYVKEMTIGQDEEPGRYKIKIEMQFHDYLREREHKARREVERLYQHIKIETDEAELARPVFEQDLFAKSTWSLLGLTPKQLIGLGAITGATIGGILDAAVGGASFMMGTVIGGTIGGASAFYLSAKRFASLENITRMFGDNKLIKIGPHKNPNFPWILLDRALLHYHTIRDLAHSRREVILLTGKDAPSLVTKLDAGLRKELSRLFEAIRKKSIGDLGKEQQALETILVKIISEL